MDSIRSPINNKFRKTMAMTRNRGALTSTSSSPLELSDCYGKFAGNVGENENGVLHHTVEKKRRLDVDKTKLLEKYFEMESKLEPQRKIQLSRELDLRPRQVAVWFQNRRARWKTKRLQSDYDALKSSYINLKSNYQALLQEKQNLISQLGILNKQLQNISRGGCDEEIESAQKEITNSVSSFENPTSVMDSMSTGEDVLNTRPKYGSGIRNEGNSDHPLYGGHSHNDQHPSASLKFLPDHITALTGKSTDQGVLCGRAVNPSLTPQQFLRLDDCFLHNQQANYFPTVEDQLTVPLPWWEWP